MALRREHPGLELGQLGLHLRGIRRRQSCQRLLGLSWNESMTKVL